MQDPQRPKEGGFIKRILGFFKWYFIMAGVMVTLTSVGALVMAHRLEAGATLPDRMILKYTFKKELLETADGEAFGPSLLRPSTTFRQVVDALKAGAKDTRVKGFVAHLQELSMNPAQIQELRDTLADFRAAGKFTGIYTDDLGGMGGGMGKYYLATAFEQIWLQPVGALSMNGIAAEVPFFKGVLDKIGVAAEFRHKGIYKSMPESLTQTGMTPPHREMMTALVGDLADQIESGIAAARKIPPAEMKTLVDNAPYNGEEALKLKLIDKIGYAEDMEKAAKEATGDPETDIVNLRDYAPGHKPERIPEGKKSIGLIVGAGDIISYSSQSRAGLSGSDMAADKIVKAFKAAAKDKDVAAVVFRIDSPGGSPEAAESIRHAVMQTQKAGKPVIVSMGGYAASGGYWVASPADKIVAEPATVTGSIGVFGGKFVLSQLWEKLGIHWESVATGENARMWSSNEFFTDKQRAKFDAMLGDIYDAFIARVAEGRKMSRDEVEAVAQGRVWTGRQAKEKKLVDELGGLEKAVALAKVAGGLTADEDVPLKSFPAKKSPLEKLVELVSEDEAALWPEMRLSLATLWQLLHQAHVEGEALRLPPVEIH